MNASVLRRAVLLLVFVLASIAALGQTTGTVFNVNSTADKLDVTPGDGICSTGARVDSVTPECTLRAALDEANAQSKNAAGGLFTVKVQAGTYALSATENCNINGYGFTGTPLCIAANVTLIGDDPATTIVDGGGTDRDILIQPNFNVAIANFTIQNGSGPGGYAFGGGGGIFSESNLTVSNSIFTRNISSVNYGSAIENAGGNMVIKGCTFMANTGNVVYASQGANNTSIDLSYFTQNTADGTTAVNSFYSIGVLQISNSTFTYNHANGNAIIGASGTPTTIVNSTISYNTVGNSGLLDIDNLVMNNDTLYGNTAGNNQSGISATNLQMANTIIAGDPGFATNRNEGDLCVGNYADLGHNILQQGNSCNHNAPPDPTTLIGVDPMLGSLALNGGKIPTLSPLPGSPAIGGGGNVSNSTTPDGSCTALDERLFVRGGSGPCTVGAIEPLGVFATTYVIPTVGGAGGTVTPIIHGAAFLPGSTVVLRQSGQPDLVPTLTTVAPDTHSIAISLDLTNAAVGAYDVVVTPPTGAASTLTAGFTVQPAAKPVINTDIVGNNGIRPGRTAIFSFIYGNSGNADAYLVPVVLSLPGTMSYTLIGAVLPPPPAAGQVIKDFSTVPMLITPLPTATGGVNNVSILIPVIPAGSSAELQFSLYLAPTASHGDTFSVNASPGAPYGTGADGAASASALSNIVTAAKAYAETNLGVTISAQTLAKMTTYASTQFAQEIAAGKQALGTSALGQPVFFSEAQLQIDIAAYGAKLQTTASTTVPTLRPQINSELLASTDLERGRMEFARPERAFGPHSPVWEGFAYFGQGAGGSNNAWTVSECRQAPGYVLMNNECVPTGQNCLYGACHVHPISFPLAVDPNEKDGPTGIGSANYTLASSTFPYQVEFENQATATGAAQTVTVTDPIDTTKFDLSTFSLGAITFGAYSLSPPVGLTSYAGAVDLRPTQNVLVAVTANLNKSSGVATWTFTSLDPNTMQLTGDPNAGFLPPDTNPPAGIGRVAFNVKPLAAAPDGQICNTASIVFDLNAAIATSPSCNTKDTTAPVSQVQALAATQPSPTFTVAWTGSDAGSGVASYTIYVAQDGGSFTPWMTATATTSAPYTGVSGHSYGFYSITTDLLGNTEAAKFRAEATTLIATPAATLAPSNVAFGSVAPGSRVSATVTLTSTGVAPLTVSGFVLSDTVNFSQSNACPATLNQGQNCIVTVTFAPSAGASLTVATTATLALTSNAGSAPAPVSLSGFAGSQSGANVWVVNGNQTVSQLLGTTLNNYSGGGSGIAIDHAGNVWSGNLGGSAITEFSSAGTVLGSFNGGGISSPIAVAIDGLGTVWIANANGTLSSLSAAGAPVNATPVGAAGSLAPASLTIDAAGSLWIANTASNTVSEVIGAAAPVVAPTVTAVTNKTLGTQP